MKQLLGKDNNGKYYFNPASKTITFFDIVFTQEQLLTITNTTDGTLIYVFADNTLGGTLDQGILTLTYNTTSMSDTDKLQIYIDVPSSTSYPVGNTTVNIDGSSVDKLPIFSDQIENVFGNTYLKGFSGGLKVEDGFYDQSFNGTIITGNSQFGANFNGKSVAVIQLDGTFAGTITFEGTANGGTWIAINGQALGGTSGVSTSTTVGIFRFNVTGLTGIRCRYTAYTSGQCVITINISSAPTGTFPPIATQATGDANLATVFGGGTVISPTAIPIPIVPLAPTTNAGAVGNLFNMLPSIYPKLRVEASGSERLPLAQEKNTNRLQVVNSDSDNYLRQILTALKVQNCLLMQWIDKNGFANLQVPDGYEDILTKIKEKGD
jgi:hypothetical protein